VKDVVENGKREGWERWGNKDCLRLGGEKEASFVEAWEGEAAKKGWGPVRKVEGTVRGRSTGCGGGGKG